MGKKKYPSELNTKHIRVNVGDYQLLKQLSIELNVTIAELVHEVVLGNSINKKQESVSPQQIMMPIQTVRGVIPNISRSVKLNVRKEGEDGRH